ncbi:unnamed protein product [Discosporangium mesarthrocarpum]
MLVVSLRMQRLAHWLMRKRCLDGLSEENLMDLLGVLEAAADTALRFNRHHTLRRELGAAGFMSAGRPTNLCPTLDQEVMGYNPLLRTLVMLSCGVDVDTGEPMEGGAGWPFAQERLTRVCKNVITAFADRDDTMKGYIPSQPGTDQSALAEEVRMTTPLVILALKSIMHISPEQVEINASWMYSTMVRLIRCDNDAVRAWVYEILSTKLRPVVYQAEEGVGQ